MRTIWDSAQDPLRECSIRNDPRSSVLNIAPSHQVMMKADVLKSIASNFEVPKIVPGVHVGLKDTIKYLKGS